MKKRILVAMAAILFTTAGIVAKAEARQSDCSAFSTIIERSAGFANMGQYVQAASLREKAASLFQHCLLNHRAPTTGMYPFDGVNAFAVAATLWHEAGKYERANSALESAETALTTALGVARQARLSDSERLYYERVKALVDNEKGGHWGVWN